MKIPILILFVLFSKFSFAAPCNSGGKLGWPVDGKSNTVTSPFGASATRNSVDNHEHAGVDLASPKGTTAMAACDGKVAYTGPSCTWSDSNWQNAKAMGITPGEGCAIGIKCNNGLYVGYGHLSAVTVQAGATVSRGEAVAKTGNTGKSTDYHLDMHVCNETVSSGNPYTCKAGSGAIDASNLLDSCDSRIIDAQNVNDARDQSVACGNTDQCRVAYKAAQDCVRASGGDASKGQACIEQQVKTSGNGLISQVANKISNGLTSVATALGFTQNVGLGQDVGGTAKTCTFESFDGQSCYVIDPCNLACSRKN